MIGIRADGNKQIGIGHVMRCLTIADALREQGEQVVFFLADEACRELVTSRGFDCYVTDTAYNNMEAELPVLEEMLSDLRVDGLIIDSYFVTERYLTCLRDKIVTAYLDDMESFAYPVDVLINYNVFAKAEAYPYGVAYSPERENECGKNRETLVLAGPEYAPVRREFLEHRRPAENEVKNIMITLGGSDAYNLSSKIAEKLLEHAGVNIHVVCGPFNLHKKQLYRLAEQNSDLNVHENVKEMWKLMAECDLAVSAAGSTMCELATMGVPAVTFSFVDNQKRIAEAFGERGAAVTVGHYEPERETAFLADIFSAVTDLYNDADKRKKLALKARETVDGRGAVRIAEVIVGCVSAK